RRALLPGLSCCFFSSRSRHTRFSRDWSSDVCSSDLLAPEWFEADIYKLVTFIVAGHLLVSFLPFSRKADVHSFWQYNKFLFLRFFTAVLYSSVLFVGLTIALSSIKNLFNIPIDGDIYLSLFAFMSAGFNTLFFLAGIPSDLNSFEKDFSYPKGLKVFTQYVLIPL